MTDETADELAKTSFKIESDRGPSCARSTTRSSPRTVSPLVGARWLMLERTINNLMDLQTGRPRCRLIQEGWEAPPAEDN